jgi:hypothetical protein
MSWTPRATVTVGGQDFTGATLGDVTITRGRDVVYQQPPAGYARINVIDIAGTGLDLNISRTLTVTVKDSTDADLVVFSGYVTDVSADIYDPGVGPQAPAAIYSLYAVGPLARLSRRVGLFAGRPAETDGDRILAAVAAGLATSWQEAAGAWEDVDPTVTWATFDPAYDPALIDAGVFDLVALDPDDGGYTALDIAAEASDSGEGLLYETLDGYVGWANADARGLNTSQIPVTGDMITAGGLRTSASIADLANRVTVAYPGGSETAQDDISIVDYTLFDRRITTSLANATNAGDRAEAYVERHAYPTINLDAISIRLDTLTDDTVRDQLLAAYSGTGILLTGLPATLGITRLDGFIEGTTLRLDQFRADLRLNVSDASLSYFSVRWSGVTPTLTWDTVDAMLTWQDARSL